ncbi:MAG: DUF4301 family protein [Bacteroidota bacterium]
MWQADPKEIETQCNKVFSGAPQTNLVRACKINDGILSFSESELKKLQQKFENQSIKLAFFIPASGSGSRMFQFIHEYNNTKNAEINGQMEHFINSLEEFAFYRQLSPELKKQFQEYNFEVDQLCKYLLESEGLGYVKKPKGLIPFHTLGPFILNPFQEHLIQGSSFSFLPPSFHFTIQKEFENEFKEVLKSTEELHGDTFEVHFSHQSSSTNSIAFDENREVLRDKNDQIVTRPSGHGALLPLLNEVQEELIFIKNIDNVQHYSRKEINEQVLATLGGLMNQFREEAKEIFDAPSLSELFNLNEKYQIIDSDQLNTIKGNEAIRAVLNRPIRICGMVRNEGQPGGGPFWIENEGVVSKQIIEKSQISHDSQQRSILLKSTHFNPVMIAACPISFTNEKFDLEQFSDPNAYFVVNKTECGKSIQYIERPGLWNGGMANWITLFIEIPNESFTPVKTVLDLLEDAHKA